MSFPRYPAYKDSGVKWLGEVPKEWVIKPIKTLASCNDEVLDENTPPEYEFDYVEISGVDSIEGIKERTTVQFANAPSRARRKVRSGDIIVSTVRTYLRAIAPVVEPTANMIVSTGFAVVRPQAVASSFLGYLFRGEFLISEVIAKSVGVSYPAINASVLMGLKVPVPPPHEQTAIATFLDRETAKIDALVADYRTLIELLQENRQAVISHAVTKGLDPTVPMKDSGVEWLEDVPEHWEVKPLKFIAIGKGGDGIQIGPYGSMLTDIQYDEPSSCKVYGQENVISGDFDRGNRWAPDSTRYSLQGYEVEPGDILFTRKGSIGQCAIVPAGISPGVIDSDTIRLRLDEAEALNGFITLGFRSAHYVQAQVQVMKTGAILSGLNSSTIASLRFAVPLRSEQTQILDYLADEIGKIDSLITDAQDAINLLQERRTALISAAVTGKIDVRGLVETEEA